ncbi:hypothetical protein GCM10027089_49510 [Nocardia thraciensis]
MAGYGRRHTVAGLRALPLQPLRFRSGWQLYSITGYPLFQSGVLALVARLESENDHRWAVLLPGYAIP